jgi:hypothetical protein
MMVDHPLHERDVANLRVAWTFDKSLACVEATT